MRSAGFLPAWPLLALSSAIALSAFCSSSGNHNPSSRWWSPSTTPPPRALRFLRHFGATGGGPGQFRHPQGISIDPAGNIYVADTGNHRIEKFDSQGHFLGEIGGFGWDPGRFNSPTGLSAWEGLNVYVADAQNRRVQRLDRDLNYLSSIPLSDGDEKGLAFGFLGDIAVAVTGELFISDVENEEVWKLTPFGELDRTFGGFGASRERLRDPTGLAIGAASFIYVADSGNNRIARYDAFGAFLGGLGEAQLQGPQGLAVDGAGYIYVADTGHNRIVAFNHQGELLLSLGRTGHDPGSFRSPMDVAVSGTDVMAVLDSGNDRVQIFQILRRPDSPEG